MSRLQEVMDQINATASGNEQFAGANMQFQELGRQRDNLGRKTQSLQQGYGRGQDQLQQAETQTARDNVRDAQSRGMGTSAGVQQAQRATESQRAESSRQLVEGVTDEASVIEQQEADIDRDFKMALRDPALLAQVVHDLSADEDGSFAGMVEESGMKKSGSSLIGAIVGLTTSLAAALIPGGLATKSAMKGTKALRKGTKAAKKTAKAGAAAKGSTGAAKLFSKASKATGKLAKEVGKLEKVRAAGGTKASKAIDKGLGSMKAHKVKTALVGAGGGAFAGAIANPGETWDIPEEMDRNVTNALERIWGDAYSDKAKDAFYNALGKGPLG